MGNLDYDLSISETEKETINLISKDISISTLLVFWQLILKVLDELSIVSSPILSLEMLITRMVHLKGMPSYEDLLESLKKNDLAKIEQDNDIAVNLNNNKKIFLNNNEETEINKISKDQIKNITQTKPIMSSIDPQTSLKNKNLEKISSIEELISLLSRKKEVQLKYDLENNVNLIKFSEGKIDISFNENLDKNFVRNLSEKLHEWTNNRWLITLEKKRGQKTFAEIKSIKKKEFLDQEKKGKIYKKFKNVFLDAELLEVKKED